jgi:DNA-binding transcriptional MerR regulator
LTSDKNSIEKKYYSIGEVARMFGVSTALIRFYETEFENIKPRKNKRGVRQFTKEDIENFRTIYFLVKEKGYTLQGAKDFLKNGQTGTTDKASVIKSLERIKDFLIEIKKNISDSSESSPL